MAKKKTAGTVPGNVRYTRDELNLLLPQYFMIRDCIDGEPAIKGLVGGGGLSVTNDLSLPNTISNIVLTRARRYLPQPNAEDRSDANLERYRAYVTRAVFYGVTGRTLEGMTGQIFLRDPVVEIPNELDILKTDADGAGSTLDQLSMRGSRHAIAYGRGGLLIDYPITDTAATKKDIVDGKIRPTWTVYNPWEIINWRTAMRGANRILTLVVLKEPMDEEGDDGFEPNSFTRYRVLRLDPTGNHTVEIFEDSNGKGENLQSQGIAIPKNAKGEPFKDIPFMFFGSENNMVIPNRPPLYDLAALNIAHYRNSADYEESCFFVGQPTPVLSGLSEDWVKNVLGGSVLLGSRASIPLPPGAKAELLQAQPNIMPFEAMGLKEQQMVALGAKLVQIQKTQKTATEKIIETTSESSTLANVAKNVSHAFVWGLSVSADYVGADKAGIKYELNDDFDLTSMTADDQNAVIAQWQSGAISFSEMRKVLVRAGTATLDDEEALKQIKQNIKDGIIPDPALSNQPALSQPPKAPSTAGGPQPKKVRPGARPGTTG